MPKVGKHLPKALTLAETQAFFSVLSSDSNLGRRDRILFELMYAGGLRVSEAVGLRVGDIDFTDGNVRIIGKGDKERRIYLKPRLIQLVREYIESEHLSGLLFPGHNHRPLTVRAVEQRIKQHAKAASLTRPVTPHTLRHSIAVHYLQGGAPVNFVQGLLGACQSCNNREVFAIDRPNGKGDRPQDGNGIGPCWERA
jgi:integrase/recombinase XerD